MAMMLRHKPTGDVYIYTSVLAGREDMEVFESAPTPPPVVPKPTKPAKLQVAEPKITNVVGDLED